MRTDSSNDFETLSDDGDDVGDRTAVIQQYNELAEQVGSETSKRTLDPCVSPLAIRIRFIVSLSNVTFFLPFSMVFGDT